MKKQRFLALLPITLLWSHQLWAQMPPEFNQFYKTGQYLKAITALENTNKNNDKNGEIDYFLGLCNSKIQEYDKAIKYFENAIKKNNDSHDIQYEYGQALYAANELKAARRAFAESANKNFNKFASLYYVAHISQMIEDFPTAKEKYLEIINNKEANEKIFQISKFQYAESDLAQFREKNQDKDLLAKHAETQTILMLKSAIEVDKSSSLVTEINQRIAELEKEFDLDPNVMKNGKRLSEKRFSAYFSQKMKFDDNVSLTNEENNVSQSKKESFIYESEAYGKYDFLLKKRFVISPEVRINFVQNSDQDSSDVYQNDTMSLNFNLKNKYEHTLFSKPASFLFDTEYSKNYKDYNKKHSRDPYAKAITYGIGESFGYFSVGDTSFKLKRKNYDGTDSSISNKTTTISFDQTASLPNQHMIIGLFEADFVDNYNNDSSSTNTYLTRVDYLIPDIMPKYTLDIACGFTITDTKLQKATRGTETTLNPSIDLSKEINEKMKISVNFDYTKNKSKQSDYAYQKSIFSTEFRYSF